MIQRAREKSESGREALLNALYGLFRMRGYDGVSLGDISEATGLGRSSLYHYFPGGKEEMAQAVVAHARDALAATVLLPLRSDGPPRIRLKAMLASVDKAFSGGREPCLLVSMLTGVSDGPVADAAKAVLRDWCEALAGLFKQPGRPRPDAERSAQAIIGQIEGALILSRALGDPKVFSRALDACDKTYGPVLDR